MLGNRDKSILREVIDEVMLLMYLWLSNGELLDWVVEWQQKVSMFLRVRDQIRCVRLILPNSIILGKI